MSEVEVNGAGTGGFDINTTKKGLSASSTNLRIEYLHTLAEKLTRKGV